MNDYVLGHSDDELDRLVNQGRFLGDLTEDALRRAGLAEGSRVLDVGCGTGDVSFLAARLVGPEGTVVGLDRAAEAVTTATRRAGDANVANVSFVLGDVHDDALDLGEPFDAIIGRLVLVHLPDAVDVLRALTRRLRPGGLMFFQEMNMSAMTSEPPCPIVDTAMSRINETFTRMGLSPRAGLRLRALFETAGMPHPDLIQQSRVDGGADSPAYAALTEITRTLLPMMNRLGIATAAEVDLDTLEKRVREEVVARKASVVPPPLVACWARTATTAVNPGLTTGRSST